jgi:thiosulfate dehydrogenase
MKAGRSSGRSRAATRGRGAAGRGAAPAWLTAIAALAFLALACALPHAPAVAGPGLPPPGPAAGLHFAVPSDSLIPGGPRGASIRRGRAILLATRDSLPAHVGNRLRCVSCHLDDGTRVSSGSWVGVYASFPQFNQRAARTFRIQDRINECLRRSLAGRPLPANGRDMADLVAYFAFLSRDVPAGTRAPWLGMKKLAPRAANTAGGARVYAARCARCHGKRGEGFVAYEAPPVWGPQSFAVGAGLARLQTAAAFVRWNMPFDSAGTLTDQQAFDVSAFMLAHPRPDTPGKERDWPAGGAPPDCPYPTLGAKKRPPATP